jgi:hypothetical protein
MNPILYRLIPNEPIYFLLIGKVVYYIGSRTSERIWLLNVYSTVKTRRIAAKKMKRESSDIIFIEWEITMKQIVEQGKLFSPIASEKVSRTAKLDIFRQLINNKKSEEDSCQ